MSGIDPRVVTLVIASLAAFAMMSFGGADTAGTIVRLIAVVWLIASHTDG
jgi:hypothetical protein